MSLQAARAAPSRSRRNGPALRGRLPIVAAPTVNRRAIAAHGSTQRRRTTLSVSGAGALIVGAFDAAIGADPGVRWAGSTEDPPRPHRCSDAARSRRVCRSIPDRSAAVCRGWPSRIGASASGRRTCAPSWLFAATPRSASAG